MYSILEEINFQEYKKFYATNTNNWILRFDSQIQNELNLITRVSSSLYFLFKH